MEMQAQAGSINSRGDTESIEALLEDPQYPQRQYNGYAADGYESSIGTMGHTPEMGNMTSVPQAGMLRQNSAYDQPEAPGSGRQTNGNGKQALSPAMGTGGGSDEMVMSLLAGQAVVDCETMAVGQWEEVESWKKAS